MLLASAGLVALTSEVKQQQIRVTAGGALRSPPPLSCGKSMNQLSSLDHSVRGVMPTGEIGLPPVAQTTRVLRVLVLLNILPNIKKCILFY